LARRRVKKKNKTVKKKCKKKGEGTESERGWVGRKKKGEIMRKLW